MCHKGVMPFASSIVTIIVIRLVGPAYHPDNIAYSVDDGHDDQHVECTLPSASIREIPTTAYNQQSNYFSCSPIHAGNSKEEEDIPEIHM